MKSRLINKTLKKRWYWFSPILLIFAWFFILPPGFDNPYSTVIEDRNGKLLGALIADDGQWRFPPPDSIPDRMKACIILFEDKNFYAHPGIDPGAIVRAIKLNMQHGKIISGGSTISMQVIRMMRKGKPRTVPEKLLEMSMALRLEMMYTKEEILSLYLSHAPFGGNVVGVEAASWRYFGTSTFSLTWADAATLAVLPNAPSLIHPGRNREILLEKRNSLLDRLLAREIIDSISWMLALSESLPGKPKPLPQSAPHLLAAMHAQHKGKRIVTTIDKYIQQNAQASLNRHVKALKENEIHNAASMILEVESGNVLAYVGNTTLVSGDHGEMVDVIKAPRSSGSILKPLLYAAMLQDGDILPGTLIPDIPTRMTGFSPKNFNDTYDGAVPADKALSRSLNVPAINMLQDYGVERFQSFLKEMGMTTLHRTSGAYGLSLILGGAEASLWDLSGIYAGMSRTLNHFYEQSGKYNSNDYHAPVLIIDDKLEKVTLSNDTRLSASAIWLTYKAMEEVNRPAIQENWHKFAAPKRVSWKTGTSFGFRDAWAIGTDPSYVVAVWAGNADGEGRPGLTGIIAAAPLMFELFGMLPAGIECFEQPWDEMLYIPVCRHSGYRIGPDCEIADSIWIPKAGLRSEPCPYHRIVHLDKYGRHQVREQCYDINDMLHASWFILPPAMEWYYKARHPWYRVLPPYMDGCSPTDQDGAMAFIYPDWDAKIFIPVELDGSPGEAVFEIAHRNPDAAIYWHLDETYLGITTHRHQMGIRPEKGEHIVTVVDATGEIAVVRFTIVSE